MKGNDLDSIVHKFKLLKESNAGSIKIILRKKDDTVTNAAIFLGGPEAEEILPIIERFEQSWADDTVLRVKFEEVESK